MSKIRIVTKSGKIIERRATIDDYINERGEQYSVALLGNTLYKVASRDAQGPLYHIATL